MEEKKTSLISIEKLTAIVSILGLLATIIIAQMNQKASIKLEEKKLESTLYLEAIEVGNKKNTLENLTFLLKLDVLSDERKKTIQKLTDSIFTDRNLNRINTDSIAFFDFSFYNDKVDVPYFEHVLRGAYVEIKSKDSINPLILNAFSDYQGRLTISYPKIYSNSAITVKISKRGFKTKQFEMLLPKYGEIFDAQMNLNLVSE